MISLSGLIEEIGNRRTCFVPNVGNGGDAVIAVGSFHFFEEQNVQLEHVGLELSRLSDYDLVIYGGGGNLIPSYDTAFRFIAAAIDMGKDVIVLPHSIVPGLRDFGALSRGLRLFCREQQSYQSLVGSGFPPDRLAIAHDMAFRIKNDFFDFGAPEFVREVAYCLRTDAEGSGMLARPDDNCDISFLWNGSLWHNRQLAESVTISLAIYLRQARRVVTDRLHIAILSALLGIPVKMLGNSYFKNKAVFEYSLKGRYPNVDFVEDLRDLCVS